MNHGSLFSGIGAPELAAEQMGWTNVFHCEWNPFGQRILEYYWPQSKSHYDITKTDFTIYRETIDVLTGGFPCQPYSNAGKRKGKEDERHLWPQMLRAIREIQPTWIVGENVSGLVNWNGGLVFEEVQIDLEAEGYEVLAFILPACGVNAPHRRDRVWFVGFNASHAYRDGFFNGHGKYEINASQTGIDALRNTFARFDDGIVTDTNRVFSYCGDGNEKERRNKSGIRIESFGFFDCWEKFPIESPVCNGNDGISAGLDRITVQARDGRRTLTDKQSYNKWREESIKAGGNAMVPPLVLEIFKAIDKFNQIIKK